jgi:chorismate mutase
VKSDKLSKLRKQIDQVDREILKSLGKRMKVVAKIGKLKRKFKMPILQRQRSGEIQRDRKTRGKKLGLNAPFVNKIFQAIQAESVAYQKRNKRSR